MSLFFLAGITIRATAEEDPRKCVGALQSMKNQWIIAGLKVSDFGDVDRLLLEILVTSVERVDRRCFSGSTHTADHVRVKHITLG